MKTFSLISLLSLLTITALAQIDCPPAIERQCYELEEPFEILTIEQGKFKLVPGMLVGNWGCEETVVQLEYYLHDIVNDVTSEDPDCFQDVTVLSFDNSTIVWPEQLIDVVGKPIDEVLVDPMLWEGLSPGLDNSCNLIYSYEDKILPVGGSEVQKIIRTVTALDWCKAELIEFIQIIKVSQHLVNGVYVDIQSCTDVAVALETYEILLNGTTVDYQSCLGTSYTIVDVLNCVAETNSLTAMDEIELTFKSNYQNPLEGISTVDMIKIQRHILGLSTLESDCSLWAADVNSDGTINGIDLVELRKLILGIYTELPQAGPERYFQDGDIAKSLLFTGVEFPLSALAIGVVNKGNVGQ